MVLLREIYDSEGIPEVGYEFACWETVSVLTEILEGEEDPLRQTGRNKEEQNIMEGSPTPHAIRTQISAR